MYRRHLACTLVSLPMQAGSLRYAMIRRNRCETRNSECEPRAVLHSALLRRFARKVRESVCVLGNEYRAGRDGSENGAENGSEKRRKVPHRDLGPVNEEPPPSS